MAVRTYQLIYIVRIQISRIFGTVSLLFWMMTAGLQPSSSNSDLTLIEGWFKTDLTSSSSESPHDTYGARRPASAREPRNRSK